MKPTAIPALLLTGWAVAGLTRLDAQSPIQIEPFPATSQSSARTVDVTTVQNHYGRCGPVVVQVLGVAAQHEDFFTIDPASGTSQVVVIGQGPRRSVAVPLSDHNGVACVTNGMRRYVLIWSNCGGTACGNDFSFTAVDVERVRRVAGSGLNCDASCAHRITGSDLSLRLNRRHQ
ncbi:MAG TPA: hypothetical protein VF702_08260 [Allosphingosinicella sp.]|jgi:hypothetical protein